MKKYKTTIIYIIILILLILLFYFLIKAEINVPKNNEENSENIEYLFSIILTTIFGFISVIISTFAIIMGIKSNKKSRDSMNSIAETISPKNNKVDYTLEEKVNIK